MFGKTKKTPLFIRFKEEKLVTFIGLEFSQTLSGGVVDTYISSYIQTDKPFDASNKLMKQDKLYVWEANDGIEFEMSYLPSFEDMYSTKTTLKDYYNKAVSKNLCKANKKRFLENKEWIEI